MKLNKYLKDKTYAFILSIISYIFIILILLAFKVSKDLIVLIIAILIIFFILMLGIDYFRKRGFYCDLLNKINYLDKSYLVLEMINKPDFYEGKILYDDLYNINKSMIENIKIQEEQLQDFKEYIEMWIHEVKIPLASLVLTFNNHKKLFDNKTKRQLKRLEDDVEQVLYYVRAENASKDYLIKDIDLAMVVKRVGLKNMDDLLDNKIAFKVENIPYQVLTDAKWLEFILGQIINNSIKYKRSIKNAYIHIWAYDDDKQVTLVIEDNGIGIPSSDIDQVFDKTFTGENGRKQGTSTGMGLTICKNLCTKLGHQITIESKQGEYTRVYLSFFKNKYFEVLK